MEQQTGKQPVRHTTAFLSVLYINALVLGAAIMGFEMLGSRYLNPDFGGSIFTWGSLIATVLLSLMIGAYVGGQLADKYPSSSLLAGLVALAGLYFIGLYFFGRPAIEAIAVAFDFSRFGLFVAALLLNVIPISLFGTFMPFAVRLMIETTTGSGRLVGQLSALSSGGSIIGTIGTTFFLIPRMGTDALTVLFGAVVLISAASLYALKWIPATYVPAPKDQRPQGLAHTTARNTAGDNSVH